MTKTPTKSRKNRLLVWDLIINHHSSPRKQTHTHTHTHTNKKSLPLHPLVNVLHLSESPVVKTTLFAWIHPRGCTVRKSSATFRVDTLTRCTSRDPRCLATKSAQPPTHWLIEAHHRRQHPNFCLKAEILYQNCWYFFGCTCYIKSDEPKAANSPTSLIPSPVWIKIHHKKWRSSHSPLQVFFSRGPRLNVLRLRPFLKSPNVEVPPATGVKVVKVWRGLSIWY